MSLKPELRKSSGMRAIIITATVRRSEEAQGEFYTARLVVGVPVCIFLFVEVVMRLYLISVTLPRHLRTPVLERFGVKGSTPVFSF